MTDFKKEFKERIIALIRDELITIESGHKVWWPEAINGYFDSDTLRVMADYLDQINAPWDAEIAKLHDADKL